MDPLTHALSGATAGWAVSGRKLGRESLLVGAVAALLPDVDVLIRSASDPLLAIEHHRGFTHSLLFIPLGGVLAALPFMARRSRPDARWYALAGTVAYATHPLLDAATTYGTQLFWPFSRYRVGLDIISIIDPLFTLIFLIAVIAAFASRRAVVVAMLVLAFAWLAIGGVQRERARSAQLRLAIARGDSLDRGAVFPTAGNTVVWRSIYQAGGMLRMDRIRVPWFSDPAYAEGDMVVIASADDVRTDAGMLHDFERFAWFSDGWIARDPTDQTVIGDARYSLRPDQYEPVWGIRFHPNAQPPTEWVIRTRERNIGAAELWREITGRSAAFRPVP